MRATPTPLWGGEGRGCGAAPHRGKGGMRGSGECQREGGYRHAVPPTLRPPQPSPAGTSFPGRSPLPAPAPPGQAGLPSRRARCPLRVVLVEVGEEQMAAAGVAALTGQVHGGTALATPVRRGGKRLRQAAPLSRGGPGSRRAPAASSSPPAPCLRSGRAERSGPAPAPPRPLPGHRTGAAQARSRRAVGDCACAGGAAPSRGGSGSGGAAKLSRVGGGRRMDGETRSPAAVPSSGVSPAVPRLDCGCRGAVAVRPRQGQTLRGPRPLAVPQFRLVPPEVPQGSARGSAGSAPGRGAVCGLTAGCHGPRPLGVSSLQGETIPEQGQPQADRCREQLDRR